MTGLSLTEDCGLKTIIELSAKSAPVTPSAIFTSMPPTRTFFQKFEAAFWGLVDEMSRAPEHGAGP
jgi:hypothetical protein